MNQKFNTIGYIHCCWLSYEIQELLPICVISSMICFAESLIEKELYLANYVGMFITNSMDSEMTSPFESQNLIVHKKLSTNTRLIRIHGCTRISQQQVIVRLFNVAGQ